MKKKLNIGFCFMILTLTFLFSSKDVWCHDPKAIADLSNALTEWKLLNEDINENPNEGQKIVPVSEFKDFVKKNKIIYKNPHIPSSMGEK